MSNRSLTIGSQEGGKVSVLQGSILQSSKKAVAMTAMLGALLNGCLLDASAYDGVGGTGGTGGKTGTTTRTESGGTAGTSGTTETGGGGTGGMTETTGGTGGTTETGGGGTGGTTETTGGTGGTGGTTETIVCPPDQVPAPHPTQIMASEYYGKYDINGNPTGISGVGPELVPVGSKWIVTAAAPNGSVNKRSILLPNGTPSGATCYDVLANNLCDVTLDTCQEDAAVEMAAAISSGICAPDIAEVKDCVADPSEDHIMVGVYDGQ